MTTDTAQPAQPAPVRASLRPPQSAARGIAWMVAAALGMTTMAVLGREASREVDTTTLMFWRSAIAFAVMLTLAVFSRGGLARVVTRRPLLHAARHGVHFLAQYGWFYAITLIPLAQLFAIEFTMPLWITLLAPLLIGERLTAARLAAAVLGFLGILVVMRPGMGTISPGTIWALVSAVGFALSVIAVRAMTATETPLRILFWMTAVQAVLALALNGGRIVVGSDLTMVWLVAIALCGLAAQYCMARAFALTETLIAMPVDFLRLPLIAVVGALLYSESLDPWVLAGGALIIAGNVANLLAERRAKRMNIR